MRMRGRWFTYAAGGKEIRALAMLHPAYLLRQPAQKKLAWQDLRCSARKSTAYSYFPKLMARETGLEPATSGVTGRRSNQLSYSPRRGVAMAAPAG